MNLLPIYSVPLWQTQYVQLEEHKEDFLKEVKKYKEENPSTEINTSSVYGYQSPDTLQKVEGLRPLFEFICTMAAKALTDLEFNDHAIVLTSAWLSVNDTPQCMNCEQVNHGVLSGVFYLKAPQGSGKLVIKNPGINRLWGGCHIASQKNQFTGESIRFEPIEGNLLIFPSYISQFVEPNDHDEERISISFNIGVVPRDEGESVNERAFTLRDEVA